MKITLNDGSAFYADAEDNELVTRLWQEGHHIATSKVDPNDTHRHHYVLLNLDAPSTFKYINNDCDYRKLVARDELDD